MNYNNITSYAPISQQTGTSLQTSTAKTPSAMPAVSAGSFAQVLAYARNTSMDAIISEIEKLGGVVTVKAVPNNPDIVRNLANSTGGHGNIIIAPNILEDMANDAEIRQKYLGEINNWLSRKADHTAMLSALGMRSVYSFMVIHEDGSITCESMSASNTEDEEDERNTPFYMKDRLHQPCLADILQTQSEEK